MVGLGLEWVVEPTDDNINNEPESQQIKESCGIQPINEWVIRRRRERDKHVTRIDAEKLVKISMENIPAGRSPGRPKRKWSNLIPAKTGGTAYIKEEE